MLQPIPGSDELLSAVKEALGSQRLPLIIGIDGRLESGKTRLAAWLWWELGIPVVHSDGFTQRSVSRATFLLYSAGSGGTRGT
jgi:hypothetical protein